MSIGQTSYSMNMAVGRAGMYGDGGNRDVASFNNQGSAVVPYGTAVCRGTADNECKLPAAGTDVTGQGKLLGIAVIDLSTENQRDTNPASHAIGAMVPVLKKGRVWVTVEENVTPTSSVYVRFADGNGGKVQKGAFRASVDQVSSADTAAIVSNARYLTTATAGNLALVEFNLP